MRLLRVSKDSPAPPTLLRLLFLTWMCSAICFPHSIETGTAEGLGARRAGAWSISSWCAAEGAGPQPQGTQHPSPPLALPNPRDLLLLGEARNREGPLLYDRAIKRVTAPRVL
ncbi:uncharacterized protein ACIBXB_003510 isoform 1-T1 [Morphnus guianensis]